MDVYCVKDRRVTPNVEGTEKVVWTKNKRKMLKVKCAVCGITKTRETDGSLSRRGLRILKQRRWHRAGSVCVSWYPLSREKRRWGWKTLCFSGNEKSGVAKKKVINYGIQKARPAIGKIGHELLDQLSTKVRPNKRCKTDRADLDGAGFDVHSAIGKLPAPKKGWTLPWHNHTGLYNPLEQQLKYNPETGEIIEIYQ